MILLLWLFYISFLYNFAIYISCIPVCGVYFDRITNKSTDISKHQQTYVYYQRTGKSE